MFMCYYYFVEWITSMGELYIEGSFCQPTYIHTCMYVCNYNIYSVLACVQLWLCSWNFTMDSKSLMWPWKFVAAFRYFCGSALVLKFLCGYTSNNNDWPKSMKVELHFLWKAIKYCYDHIIYDSFLNERLINKFRPKTNSFFD